MTISRLSIRNMFVTGLKGVGIPVYDTRVSSINVEIIPFVSVFVSLDNIQVSDHMGADTLSLIHNLDVEVLCIARDTVNKKAHIALDEYVNIVENIVYGFDDRNINIQIPSVTFTPYDDFRTPVISGKIDCSVVYRTIRATG